MDAKADRGLRAAASAVVEQGEAATSQRAAELLPRPGQPAAERAGRASESPRGLVEGESLEIAEEHRQAERTRQPPDLVVQDLGLFAGDRRILDRRDRRLDNTS